MTSSIEVNFNVKHYANIRKRTHSSSKLNVFDKHSTVYYSPQRDLSFSMLLISTILNLGFVSEVLKIVSIFITMAGHKRPNAS